jgi:hypothetical protein
MSTLITAHGLARDIDEFLRFKRAMGMPYLRGEFDLNSLRRFIVMHWGERTPVALDDAVSEYFRPSWTAFQADRGRGFSVIVDGVSD